MKSLTLSLMLLALAGCGAKSPMSGLDADDKAYLFGSENAKITFFGNPADGGALSCSPRKMNQAYYFIIDGENVTLKSVRPTSEEDNTVTRIEKKDGGYDIYAKNGAKLTFALIFRDLSSNGASISFDNNGTSDFIRCQGP